MKRSIWEKDVYGRGWYERLVLRLQDWAVRAIDAIMYGPLLLGLVVATVAFFLACAVYYGIKYDILRFKRPKQYGPPRTWPL